MPTFLSQPTASPLALEGWLYLARYVLVALLALFTWAAWKAARSDAAPPSRWWQRRSRERTLLLLASLVVGGWMAAMAAADPGAGDVAWRTGLLFGAFAILHVILVTWDHRGDDLLLPLVLLLAGLAMVEIARLDAALATRQLTWLLVSGGAALAWLAVVRDYRRLEDYKYVMLAAALLLQVVTMLMGTEVNGARLWLRVGGFEAQPVEFVKILLVGFLAAYLHQNRYFLVLGLRGEEKRLSTRYLLPLLVIAGLAEIVFVVQKDLGQGLLFFGLFLVMFFAATRRVDLIIVSLGLFVGLSTLCYHLFSHVRVRFAAWIDPWRSAQDWGFQIVQSLYSSASGGWFGSGVNRGQPWRIPAAATDFIYPSLVEEMGALVGLAILACFAVLVGRSLRIARQATGRFGSLVACGIAGLLAWQAFVIVGGTLKMIPMTGITLPFMSYGGSSLVSNFILLAVLLQISHRAALAPGRVAGAAEGPVRPEPAPQEPDTAGDERVPRRLATFLGLLFLAPALYLVSFMVLDAPTLAASPDNPRTREDLRARGGMVDRRGGFLAGTSEGDPRNAPWEPGREEVRRRYVPDPSMGSLLGYDSPTLGLAGLERARDRALRGTLVPANPWQAVRLVFGGDLRGSDLVLTIDEGLQRKAGEMLAGQRGAVVALDPRNGEILALVSSPGFDPNQVEKRWTQIQADRGAPLFPRALEGTYPPGSVIKPLVVAMALDAGAISPGDTFGCPGYFDVGPHRFHDAVPGGHGTVTLDSAITWSCNVALAQVGLRMGAQRFRSGLADLGFGSPPTPDLPAAPGSVPRPLEVTDEMLAQMSFGQGTLTVTPMQVAMAFSALAHGGRLVAPHLVREVAHRDGRRERAPQDAGRVLFREETARAVGMMMEAVVERGTGTAARVAGVRVAGKTGTAENPHGAPHAWFAAFAPVDAPRVVVVVLVENGGSGGAVAAPLARPLLEEALSRPGSTGASGG